MGILISSMHLNVVNERIVHMILDLDDAIVEDHPIGSSDVENVSHFFFLDISHRESQRL